LFAFCIEKNPIENTPCPTFEKMTFGHNSNFDRKPHALRYSHELCPISFEDVGGSMNYNFHSDLLL
jgi:hypothetical protein